MRPDFAPNTPYLNLSHGKDSTRTEKAGESLGNRDLVIQVTSWLTRFLQHHLQENKLMLMVSLVNSTVIPLNCSRQTAVSSSALRIPGSKTPVINWGDPRSKLIPSIPSPTIRWLNTVTQTSPIIVELVWQVIDEYSVLKGTPNKPQNAPKTNS